MTKWTYEPRQGSPDDFVVLDDEGVKVASVDNPYSWLGDRPDLVADAAEQTEAYARMVAASPQMLATLQDMAQWEPDEGVTLEHLAAWMRERASEVVALAKAEAR